MKKIIFILIIFTLTTVSTGQEYLSSSFRTQSYYGFSGLTFIPNTQVTPPDIFGISYSSKPSKGSSINLLPYSLRVNYGFGFNRVEVGVTNTPFYASERIYGGVSVSHGIPDVDIPVPLYPSIKYQMMPMTSDNYHVAMAIGFSLPYGGYYVVDKFFDVTWVDLTVHSGVASKLTSYHVFAGLTATFGRRFGQIRRDFNLEMLFEMAWGGSLKELDKKEESFLSLSFRHAWTPELYITTFIRYDNQPLYNEEEDPIEAPTIRMGLGLDFHWN